MATDIITNHVMHGF